MRVYRFDVCKLGTCIPKIQATYIAAINAAAAMELFCAMGMWLAESDLRVCELPRSEAQKLCLFQEAEASISSGNSSNFCLFVNHHVSRG